MNIQEFIIEDFKSSYEEVLQLDYELFEGIQDIKNHPSMKKMMNKLKLITGVGGGLAVYSGIESLIRDGIPLSKAVPVGIAIYLIVNIDRFKSMKENINSLIENVLESIGFYSVMGFVINLSLTGDTQVSSLALGISAIFLQYFGKDILSKVGIKGENKEEVLEKVKEEKGKKDFIKSKFKETKKLKKVS